MSPIFGRMYIRYAQETQHDSIEKPIKEPKATHDETKGTGEFVVRVQIVRSVQLFGGTLVVVIGSGDVLEV